MNMLVRDRNFSNSVVSDCWLKQGESRSYKGGKMEWRFSIN